jgi:hypothetical protein
LKFQSFAGVTDCGGEKFREYAGLFSLTRQEFDSHFRGKPAG